MRVQRGASIAARINLSPRGIGDIGTAPITTAPIARHRPANYDLRAIISIIPVYSQQLVLKYYFRDYGAFPNVVSSVRGRIAA